MKLLAILLIGLSSVIVAGMVAVDTDEDPIAKAESLWSEISQYKTWPLAPRSSELMPGVAPHGRYVTIHGNTASQQAFATSAARMPAGAILAKGNYSSQRLLDSITVMVREDDGWLWIVYEPEGTVVRAGDLEDCMSCHSGAARDKVFSWE